MEGKASPRCGKVGLLEASFLCGLRFNISVLKDSRSCLLDGGGFLHRCSRGLSVCNSTTANDTMDNIHVQHNGKKKLFVIDVYTAMGSPLLPFRQASARISPYVTKIEISN